jgi:hypothetical protein
MVKIVANAALIIGLEAERINVVLSWVLVLGTMPRNESWPFDSDASRNTVATAA